MVAKISKRIEIVSSSDTSLSSMSKKSRQMIYAVLVKHYTQVGITIINTEADLQTLRRKRPDLVFLGMRKVPSDSPQSKTKFVWLPDFLEKEGIPYTGSDASALMTESSKYRAKEVVALAGFNTPKYFVAKKGEYSSPATLPLEFPMFVKPTALGGGSGIGPDSVVHTFDELTRKISNLSDAHHSHALVEEYIQGREFTVGLLRLPGHSYVMAMPIEMLPSENSNGDKVIGYEMKNAQEETAVSEIADRAVKERVSEFAQNVFAAIGGRDYGRIDMRLDGEGNPSFLEANLIPSIINGSGNFQKACLINEGMGYESMLLRIVNLAFSRTTVATNESSAHKQLAAARLTSPTSRQAARDPMLESYTNSSGSRR